MTLGELLEIDYKQKSLTLEEVRDALAAAINRPEIREIPPIQSSIAAFTAALTLYTTLIEVYGVLVAAMPQIKTATKVAAIPLNPAMATEVAQDVITEVQKQLMTAAKNAVVNLKDTLLNTEIPGTD